jgi:hypothetical protein
MIILSAQTDKLEAILAGAKTANDNPCFTSWRDRTSTTFVAGRTAINTNGTSAVDISGSPGASTQRVVDSITVFNADTANITITIRFNANGTTYILFKATLSTGEMLMYQEGRGFYVMSNAGSVKSSTSQGNNTVGTSLSVATLGSDVVNNNASANTIADVTGLSFAVQSGYTYYFYFFIWYTSAATTTGSRWSINGPANSLLGYRSSNGLSAAATMGTDVFTDGNIAAYDSPSASNATSPTATAGQANTVTIEGMITASANGTVIARFASEVTSSAITAKAGSFVQYLVTVGP